MYPPVQAPPFSSGYPVGVNIRKDDRPGVEGRA